MYNHSQQAPPYAVPANLGQSAMQAHGRAVIEVRQERKDTLQQAFEYFSMDGMAPVVAQARAKSTCHDPLLDDDVLLDLLMGDEQLMPGPEHTTAWGPGPGSHISDATLALTELPDFEPILPGLLPDTPCHPNLAPPPPQPPPAARSPPLLALSAPPPPPPVFPPLPSNPNTSCIAAAVGAALGISLRDDPYAIQLATTCSQTHHVNESAEARVEQLEGRLQDAVADLLIHMDYPSSQARAMARGDLSVCTDVEARGLEKILPHLHEMVTLYRRVVQGGSTAAAGTHSRRATADSAGSAATRLHTAGTAGSPAVSGSSWQPGSSSGPAGGGSGGAAAAQAAFHTGLALSLDSDLWVEERFKKQLVTCACQLWALMNVVNPHPSRQVKEGLASYTGRSIKQVTDWFTNWRARHWKKLISNV